MKIKKYPLVTFTKALDNDIVFLTLTGSFIIDLKIAQDLITKRIEFFENKDHYLIVDSSKNLKVFTKQAKELMQDPELGTKYILGMAYIVTNPVTSLFVKIMMKATPLVPSNSFSNEKDAVLWIQKLKESNKQI